MGQGVDLPDPLNKPPPDPTSKADDLLARLAGEEIDRLLAEAEVERAPVIAAPAPAPAAAPVVAASAAAPAAGALAAAGETDPAVDKQLDALFAELTAEADAEMAQKAGGTAPPLAAADVSAAANVPGSGTAASAESPATSLRPLSAATAVAATIANELESLSTSDADSPAPAGVSVVEPPLPVPSPFAMESDEQMGAEEREALTAEITTTAAALAAEADDPAPPWRSINWRMALLRPLEWINLPLSTCSDALRDMLGKVAIVTLLHATAILLYVFLFRHK